MGTSVRAVAFVILSALCSAQEPTTPTPVTPPTPTTPPTTPPTTGGGTSTGPTTATQQPQSQQSQQPKQLDRPIFVTGTVLLPDGTEPPERVLIERLCAANQVRSEGYTDSKGRFSIQLGQSLQLVPDASQNMLFDGTQGFSSGTRGNTSTQSNADPFFDCELRARLAGFRSSTILLAGRKAMDNPAVGVLTIFPILKTDGLAMSATSAGASKDARKAFEKGMSEAKKQKLDAAEKEFRRAVELHPKYAEAWLELGKTYVSRKRLPEAREALGKAIAADPQYVYPYEQMYQVAFEEAKWQELADTTTRLLRLNPYEFPGAYYFNGVAEYQLQNFDAAQKSLEKALEADRRRPNPKIHYVLGLVMIQKKDYRAAAESLTTYASLAPNDAQIPKVQALLEQIEKALR